MKIEQRNKKRIELQINKQTRTKQSKQNNKNKERKEQK